MTFWNKVKEQASNLKEQATDLNQKLVEQKAIKDEEKAVDMDNNPKKYFKATNKVSKHFEVDSDKKLFKLKGYKEQKKLKSNLGTKALAAYTLGASTIVRGISNMGKDIVFDFSDLIEFELLVDENVEQKGGLGGAIVGGALLGGTGAVVGSVVGKNNKKYCESIAIRITINDIDSPYYVLELLDKKVKTNSKEYQEAFSEGQKIISTLSVIAKQ